MAWLKPTNFTSWSFSRLNAWEVCPLAAKLSLIDKVPQPPRLPDHPMERGDRIHKLAEAYVKGDAPARPFPPELERFKEEFSRLRKLRRKDSELVVVEETWAFRKDWTVTRWDDWSGCWLRVKLDLCEFDGETVRPIDVKTGKFSPQWNLPDYLRQVELYALAALIVYADVGPELRVSPRLMYTDAGVVYPEAGESQVYTPADLPGLKKKWERAAKPMLADRTFKPKPHRFCSSCHFRKDNKEQGGGQCPV